MKKINVGLASYGMSGKVFHGPLLKVHPGFEIISVCERTKFLSLTDHPDSIIVREFNTLISNKDIDLIVVNTPDATHYRYVHQALLAGKNVVVEKPFVLDPDQGRELIKLADDRGLCLTVFQNRRWDNDFLTLKKIIDQKWVGRIVELESHFDRYRNYIQPDTWKENKDSETGIEYNLGSHLIDQALCLFGKPLSIMADIKTVRTGGEVSDYFEIDMFYPGMKAKLKSSYLVREAGPRFILHGTEGSFLKWGLDPQEEMLKAGNLPYGPNWGIENEDFWGILNSTISEVHFNGKIESIPGNYMEFYNNLYQVLTSNETLAVTPHEALQNIELIVAAQKSMKEKRVISLQ